LAVAGIVVLVSLVSPPELAAEQTAGAARTGAPSPDVGAGPRPFDPLGIDEVKRAESIAPAVHDLSEALKGSRFRILVLERHEEDKEDAEKHPDLRRADITIYQYAADGAALDRTLYALVDLGKGGVAELRPSRESRHLCIPTRSPRRWPSR
jgi:hypothetical protein